MAQSATKHVRPMPLRLDNRDRKELAVIRHYEGIFVGRRNDFLRTCLIAGYEKLYGPIAEGASIFSELSYPDNTGKVPGLQADKKPDYQEKFIENEPEPTKKAPRLTGLIGNQT